MTNILYIFFLFCQIFEDFFCFVGIEYVFMGVVWNEKIWFCGFFVSFLLNVKSFFVISEKYRFSPQEKSVVKIWYFGEGDYNYIRQF